MLVLGIDTSTPATGVALCEVNPSSATSAAVVTLGAREVVDPRHSAEILTPLVTRVLTEAGLTPQDLDAVVSGVGPGPYTSLRVGIVTAAALGDALAVPVHGICSLDGFSDRPGDFTAVTDARRREVYWARYSGGIRVAGPEVSAPQAVADALGPHERVVGAGAELYAAVFGAAFDADSRRYPDPAVLVARAVAQLATPAAPLVPLYQRRPDATPRTAA